MTTSSAWTTTIPVACLMHKGQWSSSCSGVPFQPHGAASDFYDLLLTAQPRWISVDRRWLVDAAAVESVQKAVHRPQFDRWQRKLSVQDSAD
jgi:hypothetical protein